MTTSEWGGKRGQKASSPSAQLCSHPFGIPLRNRVTARLAWATLALGIGPSFLSVEANAAPSSSTPVVPGALPAAPAGHPPSSPGVAQPMAVRPLNGPAPALSDNDEIILEIRTAHGEMTDSITGHGLRRSTYLPLGAIAHFLDLPIAISDNGNYASGWFLDTKRTISLNLREHKLIVQGREIPLGTGDAAARPLYERTARAWAHRGGAERVRLTPQRGRGFPLTVA